MEKLKGQIIFEMLFYPIFVSFLFFFFQTTFQNIIFQTNTLDLIFDASDSAIHNSNQFIIVNQTLDHIINTNKINTNKMPENNQNSHFTYGIRRLVLIKGTTTVKELIFPNVQ